MKKLNNLLLLTIVSLISMSLNAQSVDEIIETYFENTGGAENWELVEGMKMNASINQMGMDIPLEMVQFKDKMYTKISV